MPKSSLIQPVSTFEPLPAAPLPEIKTPVEYAFETLRAEIEEFQDSLENGEAVGGLLASFGKTISLQITRLTLSGQFFCFDGIIETGEEARLVQHFTQTSVLLVKVRTEKPTRPIGFLAQ
ncbi:DUF6173 family protein [Paraburkholderia antibiotica]|uniref:Uncharacterized protein n=1 Tax=Paraburkholderia antibiotica TaxID=2728839 RepID=A0A7X9X4X8_9BURK|nr:DUF6173 family protein [Paraburkholderia antibiotica]NML31152.1 hypothetical protein [Paraburkholderia antibiotica]